jgi:lambda family phage minor tail protein L
VRDLTANQITQKNLLQATSPWLALFDVEIETGTTLYLTPNPASVAYGGNTYVPFAMEYALSQEDAQGQLGEMKISIQNVTREFAAYMETHTGLRGVRVIYREVHSAYLADPPAREEEYEVTASQLIGQQWAEFTLGHERTLTHQIPGRRFYRDACTWTYKSAQCGYVGPLGTCSKTLEGPNGCRVHHNVERFGGFPQMVFGR